ncbi:MAG: hypothetical protein KatS3mg097_506 [Candidatus Parcubacteria bacterium]|nr:MAG: hypothetical protein KatS3mg097_506 [Candidatus Parcubacteria bacterium]
MKSKILLILSSEQFSGGEKVALEIAKNLKSNFDFIFFLPGKPQKEFEEELKNFEFYYSPQKSFLEIIKNLKKTITFLKPSIINTHGTRASVFLKLVLFLTLKKKFKFIYTLHGAHFVRRKFSVNFIFLIWELITNYLFVDYLICVGKDDYDLIKKLKLINKNKLFLIENGINFEEYQNIEKGYLRKNFNLKNEIILTTICRLHYPKDLKTLINAVNLIKDENIVLFIVGDGPDRNELEDLVRNLNLENKIKFLGFRKEIKEILQDTDIFILSTRWEGLPLVILEAWATKKPVIASDVHGIRGLIKNEESGILFKFGDLEDLKKKILLLIKNENLKFKIANNGYELVKKKYNIFQMAQSYKEIYNR